ncbi:MAG: hypothetical protein LBT78_11415, partial [Tannerella sp.]|nr:hypothetical protein [Tannerella sp.]
MKSFPKLSLLCLFLFTCFSCNRETVPVSEFAPYISAYTSGLIYPTSTIRIELANEQSDVEPNTEVKEKLFSFSPGIKGKAYWVNNRTIEFIPEEGALKSDRAYEAKFKLGKVMKVDSRYKVFPFSFKVEDKNLEIWIDSPEIPDSESATIKGEIHFSNAVDLTLVEKAFSATT